MEISTGAPIVSVIMPAYNAERFISEAIVSILEQTYKNIELVIVDDASTDKTREIIHNQTDNRIRTEYNESNRGIAYTTNRGIKLSKGEYIALLDDDDIAMPERIELQVKFLEQHREIDILGGGAAVIDENGQVLSVEPEPRHNPKYIRAMLLFQYQGFPNSTTMIRRSFIERTGIKYHDGYHGMQDLKFFMDSSRSANISSIPNIVLKLRRHENNETKNQIRNHERERELLYAQMQRESIYESGFRLDAEYLSAINRVCAEFNTGFSASEDVKLLYHAFREMLDQANEMNIDYDNELRIHLKKLFMKHLEASDILSLNLWDKADIAYRRC